MDTVTITFRDNLVPHEQRGYLRSKVFKNVAKCIVDQGIYVITYYVDDRREVIAYPVDVVASTHSVSVPES